MQTLVKCPNCDSVHSGPYYKPDCDHNRKCKACGHTFKWEDT